MLHNKRLLGALRSLRAGIVTIATAQLSLGGAAVPLDTTQAAAPITPIQHVIIIVGENRTFDHLFATYVPRNGTVNNLFSQGIITANGKPGTNYRKSLQFSADVSSST